MACEKCKKHLSKEGIVEFDEFGKLEEAVPYCYDCFIEIITTKFNSFGDTCEKCGAPLELKTDNLEEDVIEEKILWYYCKQALEVKDYEDHDSIGEYITQPRAD